MPKVKLNWTRGPQFVAEDEEGHAIVVGSSFKEGEMSRGFKPLPLILVALGGCMGLDIVSILEKKQQKINELIIEIEGQRAGEHPKRFTDIEIKIKVKGEVTEEALQRALELSRGKYGASPISVQILKEDAEISICLLAFPISVQTIT
ncbi:MAG: OsmC family protein [Candidatus Edwardsbacteria bacterium]